MMYTLLLKEKTMKQKSFQWMKKKAVGSKRADSNNGNIKPLHTLNLYSSGKNQNK